MQIENATGVKREEFSLSRRVSETQEVFLQMRKKADDSCCRFYDRASKRCGIYAIRPVDCRLYPLDIKTFDGEYHWILYQSCPFEEPLPAREILDMVSTAEMNLLPALLPELRAFSSIPTDAHTNGKYLLLDEINGSHPLEPAGFLEQPPLKSHLGDVPDGSLCQS